MQEPKVRVAAAVYEMVIPSPRQPAVTQALADFLGRETWMVEREAKGTTQDFRPAVLQAELREGTLRLTLDATQQEATPRPHELLAELGLGDWQAEGLELVRADVELAR